MKVQPRATATRVIAKRITAPVVKPSENDSTKKILLLSYLDNQSRQQHDPTTKELFLYAAGNNEEGELPDGLDRLADHQFIVHKNDKGRAIGLDVIPARLYRSGVIPVSQIDVKTMKVRYDLGGAVARVIQRPFNTRAEQSQLVIMELDKLISAGKAIHSSMKLGNIGTVVNTTDDTVEVRLKASRRGVTGAPSESLDSLVDMAEDA